ncbi:unnamed protein product, partial [Mesorhabditis spiculigera]
MSSASGDNGDSPPELIPKNSDDERGQLTEEDLFRMKDLATGSANPASEHADPSIVSLADSSSNFDEHITDEYDDLEEAGTGGQEKTEQQHQSRIFGGFMFERKRPLHIELPSTVEIARKM